MFSIDTPSIQRPFIAVLYITYNCNDTCDFCFVKDKINCSPSLSFADIKQNFLFFQKKYFLEQIILSGGEPTLHPDFFKILSWFILQHTSSLSLNTNAIPLSNNLFFDQLKKEISNSKTRFILSVSVSSIYSWPPKTQLEQKKISGVRAAMKMRLLSKANLILVFCLTKQNIDIFPELVQNIIDQYEELKLKYSSEANYCKNTILVEVRNVYLEEYMTDKQKENNIIKKFAYQQIMKGLNLLLNHPSFKIRLFNLPFCYFSKDESQKLLQVTQTVTQDVRLHIDHDHQLTKVKEESFHESNDFKECNQCILKNVCNKIQPEYLKLEYPKLQAW